MSVVINVMSLYRNRIAIIDVNVDIDVVSAPTQGAKCPEVETGTDTPRIKFQIPLKMYMI